MTFDDQVIQGDALELIRKLEDESVDLVIADPPYALGKDFGNDSDMRSPEEFLKWTTEWVSELLPKLSETASVYIFTTWRYSPEIFVMMKNSLQMINEIIWDRRVPSMGGSTRRFSSVHDTIGLFAKTSKYIFDLDAIRIPYDEDTKKARSRSIFVGKKWLELGYNPKDVWSVSRLHRLHAEREDHPTQKPLEIIERMVLASSVSGATVLDPFCGSGTTGVAALRHGRRFIGFELNPIYVDIANRRIQNSVSQQKLL